MSGTLPEPLSFCPNDDVPQHPGSTTPAHSACRFTNLCCNGPSARHQPVPRPRFLCRFTGISRSTVHPHIHRTDHPLPPPPFTATCFEWILAEASTSFRVDFSVRRLGTRICGALRARSAARAPTLPATAPPRQRSRGSSRSRGALPTMFRQYTTKARSGTASRHHNAGPSPCETRSALNRARMSGASFTSQSGCNSASTVAHRAGRPCAALCFRYPPSPASDPQML